MSRQIRKGDIVKHYANFENHHDRALKKEMYGRSGIVLAVRKKEVARNKSKHVMEIVIAHTADIMWDTGSIENDVPVDVLHVVSKGK